MYKTIFLIPKNFSNPQFSHTPPQHFFLLSFNDDRSNFLVEAFDFDPLIRVRVLITSTKVHLLDFLIIFIFFVGIKSENLIIAIRYEESILIMADSVVDKLVCDAKNPEPEVVIILTIKLLSE